MGGVTWLRAVAGGADEAWAELLYSDIGRRMRARCATTAKATRQSGFERILDEEDLTQDCMVAIYIWAKKNGSDPRDAEGQPIRSVDAVLMGIVGRVCAAAWRWARGGAHGLRRPSEVRDRRGDPVTANDIIEDLEAPDQGPATEARIALDQLLARACGEQSWR